MPPKKTAPKDPIPAPPPTPVPPTPLECMLRARLLAKSLRGAVRGEDEAVLCLLTFIVQEGLEDKFSAVIDQAPYISSL